MKNEPYVPMKDAGRVTDLFACRDLVCRELSRRGVPNVEAAWSDALETAMAQLPAWILSLAGIGTEQPTTRQDNTSGYRGVDWRGARGWRCRVQRSGRVVFCKSGFRTAEAAAKARAEFLRQNPDQQQSDDQSRDSPERCR